MNIEFVLESVINWLATTGIKVLLSFVYVGIAFPVINRITKVVKNRLEAKNVDKTITKTTCYILKIGLKILIICGILGYFGIDTASVSALIATLGVGVGLAVQGSLSNFAGGVLLLLTRPFKVDDMIEVQGYIGVVEDIHIIYTTLSTVDGKVISIPNGALANGTIVNYSVKSEKRLDEVFSISYNNDFEKAKKIITDVCEKHDLILKDKEIFCRVSKHSASSVDITLRVWTNACDYWAVHFDLLEQIKKRFDEEGIEIPYNQIDVNIKNK